MFAVCFTLLACIITAKKWPVVSRPEATVMTSKLSKNRRRVKHANPSLPSGTELLDVLHHLQREFVGLSDHFHEEGRQPGTCKIFRGYRAAAQKCAKAAEAMVALESCLGGLE
jgi:hypothetical protein